ncbi:MAG: hypothetical protein OHK0050_40760 [Roseiflexaceae bacterium]
MPDPTISFGAWIRQRRRMLDLTQIALADQINCAVITIKKIESDQRRPSIGIAEHLADALQIPHDARELFIQIARGQQPLMRLPSLVIQKHVGRAETNIPIPPYPLIGRQEELHLLMRFLEQGQRLVTIYGAPGIGKTRLLQELGQQLLHTSHRPIRYIDLTPVQSSVRVAYVIQRLLGMSEHESVDIVDQLISVFKQAPQILLLDNFEQVIDAAPLIADLLSACPDLVIVVTSRITLRLRAEHVVRMLPLSTNHATNLFLIRAQAIHQQIGKSAVVATRSQVQAIVQRLDCLPLAIELAATRLDTYSLSELLDALQQCSNAGIQLLTAGSRDLPAHQQTIYDAIAWSYQLLPATMQQIFRRLSVFHDGWDHSAALGIANCDNSATAMLVRHSLIVRTDVGTYSRFRLLELIREYAHEQLSSAGELISIQSQHARYFCQLVEQLAPQTLGAEQVEAIQHLNQEYANIRAALIWLVHHEITTAITLILDLGSFWIRSGQYREGIQWVEQVLQWAQANAPIKYLALAILLGELERAVCLEERSAALLYQIIALPPDDQYNHLRSLAICHIDQNFVDPEEFRRMVDQSITFFRSTQNIRGLCMALLTRSRHIYNAAYGYATPTHYAECRTDAIEAEQYARQLCDLSLLATVITWRSFVESRCIRLEEARSFQEEAIAILRRLGYTSELAWGLRNLGMILGHMGNCEAACQSLSESLQLMRQLHVSIGLAWTTYELGRAYARCGDDQQALALLEEGLALSRSIHEGTGMACSHHWLGRMAFKHAQWHAASEHLHHSLDRFYHADNRNGVLEVLPSIAEYLGRIEQPEQAACLLAAAANLREQLALPAQPIEIEETNAIAAAIRFRLSTYDFGAATMRGTQLSYEQAYTMVLDLLA